MVLWDKVMEKFNISGGAGKRRRDLRMCLVSPTGEYEGVRGVYLKCGNGE